MARRLGVLAGLLCVLLHAGLVVAHHALPDSRTTDAAASVASASGSSDLAHALMASLCRPGGIAGDGGPSEPAGHGGPCVICCCPAATPLVAPFPVPFPHRSREPLRERAVLQARQIATPARIAERPPIRGPPDVA